MTLFLPPPCDFSPGSHLLGSAAPLRRDNRRCTNAGMTAPLPGGVSEGDASVESTARQFQQFHAAIKINLYQFPSKFDKNNSFLFVVCPKRAAIVSKQTG